MNWYTFYCEYAEMSDPVLRENVLSLSDIDSGRELVDVITGISNYEIRLRLFEKAVKLNVVLSENDYMRLDGEMPSAVLSKFAQYGEIKFGSADQVTESLVHISDVNAKRALYERAYIEDVKFTPDQLDRIGYEDIDSAHKPLNTSGVGKKMGCGCFLALFVIFVSFLRGKKRKN